MCVFFLFLFQKNSFVAFLSTVYSSHQITSDVSLAETCHAAELFLSDGLIITGSSTGQSASLSDVTSARTATPQLPVILGSGVTPENLKDFSRHAQALIVGSYFKKDGLWKNELCRDRIDSLVSVLKEFRLQHQKP